MVRFCTDLIRNSKTWPSLREIQALFRLKVICVLAARDGTPLAHTRPATLHHRVKWVSAESKQPLANAPPPAVANSKGVTVSKREKNIEIPFSERTKQAFWFTSGALCGLAMLSICKASLPPESSGKSLSPSNVTDDTAIYQNMSEIQMNKERAPNFDGDISNLSQMERRYPDRPALARPRVAQRSTQKTAVRKKTRRYN